MSSPPDTAGDGTDPMANTDAPAVQCGADCSGSAECSVCLEPITATPCVLQCGHTFHSQCLLQAVVVDPRCPNCRRELARPPTPAEQRLVSISLNDVEDEVNVHYAQLRRAQLNYDSRRRRFIRRRPELACVMQTQKDLQRHLREMDAAIERAWNEHMRQAWAQEPFVELKKKRSLLMRRMRRCERLVRRSVEASLGARPEIDMDSDDEVQQHVMRAIANLSLRRDGAGDEWH